MKVAFLTCEKMDQKVKNLITREFEEIKLSIYKYDNYEEVIDILKSKESKFDVIVFGGYIPYYIALKNIRRTVPWYYMKIKESCIKGELLKILSSGYKVKNISCDSDKNIVEEIYNELGIDYETIYGKYESVSLEYEIERMEDVIEDIYLFHRNLYLSKKVNYCLTSICEVSRLLSKDKIPNSFVKKSNDTIRNSFEKIYLKYIATKNQNSQIVTFAVAIDMPNEYSINKNDEYSLVLEKEKLEQEVYKFAYKIKAAVVQESIYTYLLFSTKEILELETDYFSDIELVRNIEKMSIRTISVGIGYGDNTLASKYNAYRGLNTSKKDSTNSTYVVYEDESINGPIYAKYSEGEGKDNVVDNKLLQIAIKSHLSTNTINTIYEISNKLKKDTFTSKELADLYGISNRGINKILVKLEDAGFIEVVGSKINSNLGRPSRIIKLKF